MEPDDVLQDLDLTDTETDLYLALLREGEGTASHIAKKAGVGRRLAYDKFQALKEKGLVSYTDKDNKRVYKPTNPQRLNELLEDRRQQINELENKVEDILPQLTAQFNQDSDQREVRILEGRTGIKQLFNDELREADDTIYLIGSPEQSEDMLEHFIPAWTKKRAEEGIAIKGVFEHSMRGMLGERGAETHARYLPEGHESTVSIAVYGDKAGIIFWIDDPLVIMIDDPDAAASFHSYFQLIWEAAEE